jgi:hypothetical protein
MMQWNLFDLRVCCYLYVPSMLTQDFSCRGSVCVGEVDEALNGGLLRGCVCWRHGCTVSAGCIPEDATGMRLGGNRGWYTREGQQC